MAGILPVQLLEAAAVLDAFSATEASAVGLAEAASAVVAISASDSLAVQLVDVKSQLTIQDVVVSVQTSDAATGLLTDATPFISGTVSADESLKVVLGAEDASIFGFTPQQQVSVSTSDTLEVHLGTAPVSTTSKSAADALAVSLTDTATQTLVITLSAADSLRVAAAEATPQPVPSLRAADTVLLGLTEPQDTMFALGALEAIALAAVDPSPAISGSFTFNATDSLAVQASDATPTLATVSVKAADSASVTAAEGGQLVTAVAYAADTLSISQNDAASLLLKLLAVTDSLGIGASDAATLFNTFIQVAASESVSVGLTDAVSALQSLLTQLATTESLSLDATDALNALASNVGAVESLAGTIDEAILLSQSLTVADSAAVRMIDVFEALDVNAFVIIITSHSDEALAVGLDDTASVIAFIPIAASDSVSVSLDDVALTEASVPETWDGGTEIDFTRKAPDPMSYRIRDVPYMNVW